MTDKPRDWFSVEATFNVTGAEELFEFLQAASMELLEEADVDYDAWLCVQDTLAELKG